MTEAEINLAIAKIEYPNEPDRNLIDHNYCSEWSAIGPIIEREKITTTFNDTYLCWIAHDGYNNFLVQSDSLTEAAALCYLNMKGVE